MASTLKAINRRKKDLDLLRSDSIKQNNDINRNRGSTAKRIFGAGSPKKVTKAPKDLRKILANREVADVTKKLDYERVFPKMGINPHLRIEILLDTRKEEQDEKEQGMKATLFQKELG